MNKLSLSILLLGASLTLLNTSCSKDDETTPADADLEIKAVADLDGTPGTVYYSLALNQKITAADTTTSKWDIMFKGTTIYVNSGSSGTGNTQAQVVSSTFEDLLSAPETGYKADATGAAAISGWYTYTNVTEPQHAILTVPGKIIVLKTSDGKYAKLEMISYYKGNPNTSTATFADLATRPASKYYTFRYALQANGSTDLK